MMVRQLVADSINLRDDRVGDESRKGSHERDGLAGDLRMAKEEGGEGMIGDE